MQHSLYGMSMYTAGTHTGFFINRFLSEAVSALLEYFISLYSSNPLLISFLQYHFALFIECAFVLPHKRWSVVSWIFKLAGPDFSGSQKMTL